MVFFQPLLAASFLVFGMAVSAQQISCGVTGTVAKSEFKYPPIARAAHIAGRITMTVKFTKDGSIESIGNLSGPSMLLEAASTYVRSWQANYSTVLRECKVVLDLELDNNVKCKEAGPQPTYVTWENALHAKLVTKAGAICDPTEQVNRKRRRF